MARTGAYYLCAACGADFKKWAGKCPECGEWNTLTEASLPEKKSKGPLPGVQSLESIQVREQARLTTGIEEFNIVCGGGIVPGSVILIGGEPGIGKSTIALQVAHFVDALYISGEESPAQIKQRAQRLNIDASRIKISTASAVEDIIRITEQARPRCLIIDSIQTIHSENLPGIAGSVSQIRESASLLAKTAKSTEIPVILIGHITKDGSIAGPKQLEHLVDTVLYFAGDFSRDFRMLRAFKNRYGSVNELGLFKMTASGLEEVKDKNTIFLESLFLAVARERGVSGARGLALHTLRGAVLVALSSFSNPRRMTDGIDLNRLILITAVLEKHAGLALGNFDVFLNVSGGLSIPETAGDLAVAMSIASSLKTAPIPAKTGFFGELSLSGEIRPVSQASRRVQEFKYSGFRTLYVPEGNKKDALATGFTGEICACGSIRQVIDLVLGA